MLAILCTVAPSLILAVTIGEPLHDAIYLAPQPNPEASGKTNLKPDHQHDRSAPLAVASVWRISMTIAAVVAGGPLRMGASGPAVTAVQLALRNAGFDLEPDGGLGTITQTALKASKRATAWCRTAWSTSRPRPSWTRWRRRHRS